MTSRDPNPLLRRLGIASWSIIGVFGVLAIVIWLLIQASIIVIPVVFSFAIVYLLNPSVTAFERRGMGRLLGATIMYVVVTVLLFGLGLAVWPSLADQGSQLGESIPLIYERGAEWVTDTAEAAGIEVVIPTLEELTDGLGTSGFEFTDELQGLAEGLLAVLAGVLESVVLIFLAPVIAFYILVDLPRATRIARDLVPPSIKEETIHVAERLGRALGGFVRGQLVAATIVALMSVFGFWAIGLDLWLVIGIIAGALNMVPLLGPWVGGILAVSVALVTGSLGLVFAAGLVALAVQQIDNHFVSPLVLRATVKLHPSVIILSLMVGGSVAGLLGVLLAVPAVAVLKVLLSHYWRTRMLGEPWRQAAEAIVEEPEITRTGEILVERIRARREREGDETEPTSFFDETP
ncbi:MAG: AI-2E family transporter [Acidimicrobiia bacterium]|nr:MAG: AI-2E family transporter [Acidimicrobiia bacterium]